MFLSLVIGAAAGALLVALNTNKFVAERQRRAKSLTRHSNRGRSAVGEDVVGFMQDWKDGKVPAAGDLKRSMSVSINDLPG